MSTAGNSERLRPIARACHAHDGGAWLAEHDGKILLANHGVTIPESGVALTAEAAVELAAKLGGPVALKVSHADIKHKTDIGGVVLGLTEPVEIADAATRLLGLKDSGVVLVEVMAGKGEEMLVSATRDGVVPSLVIGLGGVWTELLNDVAVIPLPADADRIRVAVESLRGYTLLSGGRGEPALAIGALCQLAQSVGDAFLREDLSLVEINPVIVSRTSAVAVDAVIQK
jgi:succinyl-CoA synthetase beta subunit